MKTFVFTSLILLLGSVYNTAVAQENTTTPQLHKNISDYHPTKPMVVDSYQQPYIIKDKKLATYFKSGAIPTSFPRYNYSLTKKENIALIRDWYYTPGNKELLSEAGRARVAELQEENQ